MNTVPTHQPLRLRWLDRIMPRWCSCGFRLVRGNCPTNSRAPIATWWTR